MGRVGARIQRLVREQAPRPRRRPQRLQRFGEQGAVRYGGTLGATRYRLYSQWTGRDQSLIAPGTRANDRSHRVTTGFRADWATQPGAFTLEGDFTALRARALWPNLNPQTAAREPLASDPSDAQGGHLLGRWTHTRVSGASLQVQSFVDIAGRQEPIGNYHRRTFDVETQYHTALGAHQDLVAGGGYRFSGHEFAGRIGFSVTPAESTSSLCPPYVFVAGGSASRASRWPRLSSKRP
jgi:hypothetical protein